MAVCWIVVAITVACMAYAGPVGWDTEVYRKAMQTLHRGGDPYAEGIAAQQAYHEQLTHASGDHTPFTYVYSPLTLPVLRWLAGVPGGAVAVLYGIALVGGVLLQLWAGFQMAGAGERRWLGFVLPFTVLFPGLLCDDVILSANFVYILYGLVLAAAVPGWKRGEWHWYYLAVLAAAVFKAPLLTLLAFPILTGRRQWIPAGLTAAVGLAAFAAPARLWPELFREYMRAVFLQFEWNHDFGFSPSGMLGTALYRMGRPYSPASTICYLTFAAALGLLLLYLAGQVRRGEISREMWIPVAMMGTILMNPRIKEYDLAAITVPMLLICWRMMQVLVRHSRNGAAGGAGRRQVSKRVIYFGAAALFVVLNVIAGLANAVWDSVFPEGWRYLALLVLLAVFGCGLWELRRETGTAEGDGYTRATTVTG